MHEADRGAYSGQSEGECLFRFNCRCERDSPTGRGCDPRLAHSRSEGARGPLRNRRMMGRVHGPSLLVWRVAGREGGVGRGRVCGERKTWREDGEGGGGREGEGL